MKNFSKMQRMKAKVMTFIGMRQERWLYWWKTEILQNNYDFLNDECNDDDDDDECGLSKVVHFFRGAKGIAYLRVNYCGFLAQVQVKQKQKGKNQRNFKLAQKLLWFNWTGTYEQTLQMSLAECYVIVNERLSVYAKLIIARKPTTMFWAKTQNQFLLLCSLWLSQQQREIK